MGSAVPALPKLCECGSTRVHHRHHWRPILPASITDKKGKVKTLVARPASQSCLKLGSYDRGAKRHQKLSRHHARFRTRRPELRAAADTARFKSSRAVRQATVLVRKYFCGITAGSATRAALSFRWLTGGPWALLGHVKCCALVAPPTRRAGPRLRATRSGGSSPRCNGFHPSSETPPCPSCAVHRSFSIRRDLLCCEVTTIRRVVTGSRLALQGQKK